MILQHIPSRVFFTLVLFFALNAGCDGGNGSGGEESSNTALYEASIGNTTFYLAKKPDHFLMYRTQTHFNCYVFIRFDIESQSGNSYFIAGDNGQLTELTYQANVITLHGDGMDLEFHRNSQREADLKPKCGNPQAEGEVSVAITFQQLPDTIRRGAEDFYVWEVTFDMDNDMQTSPGDVVFTVNSFQGNNPSGPQTSIEEIGAELFVYYDYGASSGIGDISLTVEGNTMTLSAPKSLYTSLESITTQTQINVSASYSDGQIYHSDYLPGSNQFTSVMDTGDISDELNDFSGTETLVDIVNVSVTID
jgi:hypothetical protein